MFQRDGSPSGTLLEQSSYRMMSRFSSFTWSICLIYFYALWLFLHSVTVTGSVCVSGSSSGQNPSVSSYVTLRRGPGSSAPRVSPHLRDGGLENIRVSEWVWFWGCWWFTRLMESWGWQLLIILINWRIKETFLSGQRKSNLMTSSSLSYPSRPFSNSPCFLPGLSRRDLRVPWSVCPRRQKPCSSRAVRLEGGWLRRSSWSGWSATRRRWFASARGTSARANAPARASPPPPSPPSAPPPPTLWPPYVTPRPCVAAAGTGSTTFTTTAAMQLSSPQLHNNLAGMLTR